MKIEIAYTNNGTYRVVENNFWFIVEQRRAYGKFVPIHTGRSCSYAIEVMESYFGSDRVMDKITEASRYAMPSRV